MSAKRKLQQVYKRKKKRVKELKALKLKLLVDVYQDLIEEKNLHQIQKRLFDDTINFEKVKGIKCKRLYDVALQIAKSVKKKTDFVLLPIVKKNDISRLVIENRNLDLLDKEVNEIVRKHEEDEKEEIIKEELDKARANDKAFFLISKHDDCAQDHLNFQGRIYYDRESIKNPLVKELVELNDFKEFQWVLDNPVYMITRPNCRHYFQALTLQEVMNESVEKLLKKYSMHHKIGQRGLFQTLSDKNKKAVVARYRERLRILEEMKKIQPTEKIEQAINKTKLLIKKWNA